MGTSVLGTVVLAVGGVLFLALLVVAVIGFWHRGPDRLRQRGLQARSLHLFGGPLDGLVIRNGRADVSTLRGTGYPDSRRLATLRDGALDCQDGTFYRPSMRQGRATALVYDDTAMRFSL